MHKPTYQILTCGINYIRVACMSKKHDLQAPRDQLLDQIEAFLTEHAMAPSTFGARALEDRHFVRRLRAGADVKSSTIVRVREFMRRWNESPRPTLRDVGNERHAA